jgi:hypothetical protein
VARIVLLRRVMRRLLLPPMLAILVFGSSGSSLASTRRPAPHHRATIGEPAPGFVPRRDPRGARTQPTSPGELYGAATARARSYRAAPMSPREYYLMRVARFRGRAWSSSAFDARSKAALVVAVPIIGALLLAMHHFFLG